MNIAQNEKKIKKFLPDFKKCRPIRGCTLLISATFEFKFE